MLNLELLNEMQRNAVENSEIGPMLVLAGPGSGKTFTITQRIFYLIQVLHIPPQKILVLTFTKDAAASMEKRFRDDCDSTISSPYFSTFHSLFYQILRESKRLPKDHLLNYTEKKKLLRKATEDYVACLSNDKTKEVSLNSMTNHSLDKINQNSYEKVLDISGVREINNVLYQELIDAISLYKNTNNKELAQNKLSSEYREQFSGIFTNYEKLRKASCKMDFDDCLWDCKNLLEKDETIRAQWQNRFSYILIDEFQDINPVQYEVIKLLSKSPNAIFAVGDDDQAIYGFRGSNPKCLIQFREEYQAKEIVLKVNYRSTDDIVRTANKVIAENKLRFQKDFISGNSFSDNEKKKAVYLNAFCNGEEQNTHLLKAIKEITPEETGAVLFRTNSQMQKFASYLKINHVTFDVREKIKSIYEHSVVQDVMSFLKLVYKVASKDDLIRTLRFLIPKASGEVLTYIKKDLSDILTYYNREITFGSEERRNELREERNLVNERLIRIKTLQNKPFFLCIAMLRKQLGYEEYLKASMKDAEERREAFSILEWLQKNAGNYRDIGEWEQAQRNNDREKGELNSDKGGEILNEKNSTASTKTSNNRTGKIILMTIHAAKGLEFDKVWIPDCNERIYPYGILQDEETIEEERRIFYVGITRAKKYLELTYLTGTKDSPRYTSRFLKPLL